MTRDDIIRMGSEADLFIYNSDDPTLIVWLIPTEEKFLKFATLVAAAEREACAETCDETRFTGYCPPEYGIARDYYDAAAEHCAAAIRARGEE